MPNAQLVKEKSHNAIKYQGKSVAEQNSVDLAWGLLLKDDYKELRQAICGDEKDWTRFRQLVVNSVMATDIVDRELKELRNARWDKAFKGEFKEEDPITDRNRKATVVIEHLIQASDISQYVFLMRTFWFLCSWIIFSPPILAKLPLSLY